MKSLAAALVGISVAAAAFVPAVKAADLELPPAPVVAPPVVADVGGWYLRGHIGVSNQKVRRLDNALFDESVIVSEKDFDAAVFFGGGVGYQVNRWVRFDVTAEYRHDSKFNGFDTYTAFGGGTNDYSAKKKEYLFLANAYVDIGTWYGITPYLGAGIGGTRLTIGDLTDINAVTAGGGTAGSNSEWNLAWALYAGFGYQLTENWTVDLGYRYLHLGDGSTGDIVNFDGTNAVFNPLEFNDVSSHDIMIGLRYRFGGGSMPSFGEEEPLFAKF
jgi:opacity protein-like surface antigen